MSRKSGYRFSDQDIRKRGCPEKVDAGFPIRPSEKDQMSRKQLALGLDPRVDTGFATRNISSDRGCLERLAFEVRSGRTLALPTPHLRLHDAVMTPQQHDSAQASGLTCLQCGTPFECKPAGGCWCADE